jgi:hypothetical protein
MTTKPMQLDVFSFRSRLTKTWPNYHHNETGKRRDMRFSRLSLMKSAIRTTLFVAQGEAGFRVNAICNLM